MGDFEIRVPSQNGQSGEHSPSSWPLEASNPLPSEISTESWRLSENITRKIIWTIQPTKASEERRRNVVDYVQRLFKGCIGCEVFPFGSVPLKTYLPDGDIDLTALGLPNCEDTLSGEVRAVLEGEEQNNAADFEVKDVQYIHAEVDEIIGKNHLFKRTIILIKAWCYYESRILGAHHSLISTYALETLVLYIFNIFHSSLDGPLAVLYRFLDYFSKFDWDNFCISLGGPVRISTLPEIVVEMQETDLLLSTEFLNKCGETFSVTPRIMENNHRAFVKKHLNIVDPLRENNNLGRSVSKGNLYRIRSAFAYGARKLGKILLLPGENMSNELNKFLKNTLERHGRGERPDVQDTHLGNQDCSRFDLNEVANVLPHINIEKSRADNITFSSSAGDSCRGCGDLDNIKSLNFAKENDHAVEFPVPPSNYLLDGKSCRTGEADDIGGDAGPDTHRAGDAKDPITSKTIGSRITNDTHRHPSACAETSTTTKAHHAPHLFFCRDNGKIGREDLNQTTQVGVHMKCHESLGNFKEFELSSNRSQPFSRHHRTSASMSNGECVMANGVAEPSAECSILGGESIPSSGSSEVDLAAEDRTSDAYDLADLTGNYEGHFKNLSYSQWAHDFFLNRPVSPGNLSSSSHYGFRGHMYQHVNGFIPSPPFPRPPNFYPMNRGFIPGSYGLEDMPKPRGTGTYFPNTNHRSYKDKASLGKGRNQFLPSQVPRSRNNGRAMAPPESNLTDAGGCPVPIGNGHGKPVQLDFSQLSNPASKEFSQSNESMSPQELEFGSFGPVPLSTFSTEPRRNLDCDDPHSHGSRSSVSSPTVQRPGINHERLARSYRLKDEDEFPPLSSGGNQNISVHSNEHKPAWEARR